MTQSVACVYNVHDIQYLRVTSIQPEIAGAGGPLCIFPPYYVYRMSDIHEFSLNR